MQLQVLICTIGADGIQRVAQSVYPVVQGVEYLVSWQQPDGEIPLPQCIAERSDIKVTITQSRGICKNRNNAVAHAEAEICLMSDDDVDFKESELKSLIDAFRKNSDADIIIGKYNSKEHSKFYPDYSFDIKKSPKGYYVSCIEIAFKLSSIKGKVYFNENISIGTPVLRCGEEDVFIHDAIKNGLTIRYVPVAIGTHNAPSTGERDSDSSYFWMTKGAVFSYIHPMTWFPRIVVNARRASKKSSKSTLWFLRYALRGVIYAHRHKVFNTQK